MPTLWKAYCFSILHSGKKWKKMSEHTAVEQKVYSIHLQATQLPPCPLTTGFSLKWRPQAARSLVTFISPWFRRSENSIFASRPQHSVAMCVCTLQPLAPTVPVVTGLRLRRTEMPPGQEPFAMEPGAINFCRGSAPLHTCTSGMLHNPCLSNPLCKEDFLEYFNDSPL